MKKPQGKREPRPPRAPASFEAEEAEIMHYARERLAARRAGPAGDPFTPLADRLVAKMTAPGESVEPWVPNYALAGSKPCQDALARMIEVRKARGEALELDLVAYAKKIAGRGPPRLPRYRGSLHKDFGTHVAVILIVLDIIQRFPRLSLQRNPATERPSAFSVVAAVLAEAGIDRGGEEAIRKTWKNYGPLGFPDRFSPLWPRSNSRVSKRFNSGDIRAANTRVRTY